MAFSRDEFLQLGDFEDQVMVSGKRLLLLERPVAFLLLHFCLEQEELLYGKTLRVSKEKVLVLLEEADTSVHDEEHLVFVWVSLMVNQRVFFEFEELNFLNYVLLLRQGNPRLLQDGKDVQRSGVVFQFLQD